MIAQVQCTIPTLYQLTSARAFNLEKSIRTQAGYTYYSDFETESEAMEYLQGVNEYLFQVGRISEAEYQTNIQDLKKGNCMAFDAATAQIVTRPDRLVLN